jgi:hypothetical protein
MFLSKTQMLKYHRLYAGQPYSTEKRSLIAKDGVSVAWQEQLNRAYQKVSNNGIPILIFIAEYDNVVVPQRQHEFSDMIDAKMHKTASGHYLPLDADVASLVSTISTALESL